MKHFNYYYMYKTHDLSCVAFCDVHNRTVRGTVYEVGGEVHLLSNSMYQNNYLKTSHHLHIT